jgi:hypothetical protein
MHSTDAARGVGPKPETDGASGSDSADTRSAKQFEDAIASQIPVPAVRLRFDDDPGAFLAAGGELANALPDGNAWFGEGGAHAVKDELSALAGQGDGVGLQDAILEILGVAANANPSAEAVDRQIYSLRQYGPDTPIFTQALSEAETFFTTEWPEQAADEIAHVYADEGPVAAAELLADYTAAGNTDPLTAARILNAAEATIERIVGHLGDGGAHEWPGNTAGAENFDIDPAMKETVFGHLSAAADNASRSGEAGAAIPEMARLINEQGFASVSGPIADGKGAVLSLEMLSQSRDPALASAITAGIEGLKARIRESARELADMVAPFAGSTGLSGLLADPVAVHGLGLDVERLDGTTPRDDLSAGAARIAEDGYEMMRVLTAVGEYEDQLAGFDELLAAGARPAQGTDPEIELALSASGAFVQPPRG